MIDERLADQVRLLVRVGNSTSVEPQHERRGPGGLLRGAAVALYMSGCEVQ